MTDFVLEAHDLLVEKGDKVLLDIAHLGVLRSEVLVVIGPNGAGKSTLLSVLGLLEKPTGGWLAFNGERLDSADLLPYRRRMAVVFQEPLLLDTTVRENVSLGLKLRHFPHDRIEEKVRLWLDKFNISHLAGRSGRTLSGGEAQRTSLARAMVLDPEVLFLDEPFSSLDQPTKESLLSDLKRILLDKRTTVVMVTQDREEARFFGDRVGVLLGGKLRQLDRTDVVFRSPASEDIAGFVGVENLIHGIVRSVEQGLLKIVVGDVVVEAVGSQGPGKKVLLTLRPEDIMLSKPGPSAGTSMRNHFRGIISEISDRGALWRITVDCGFPALAFITRQSGIEMGLSPGTDVVASFKATSVHVIESGG